MQILREWMAEADASAQASHFRAQVPGWAATQQQTVAALEQLSSAPAEAAPEPEPSLEAWDAAAAALKMAVQLWAQGVLTAAGEAACVCPPERLLPSWCPYHK